MKKRKCYMVLSKTTRHIYGAFERTKAGFSKAKEYKLTLMKEYKMDFVIK